MEGLSNADRPKVFNLMQSGETEITRLDVAGEETVLALPESRAERQG